MIEAVKDIEDLIKNQINLPSPPAIAVQILNIVQQPEASIQDLARIISADPALTAKMLRIANSGLYSPSSQVTSVERAITVLGTNVIKNIALSFVIANDLKSSSRANFDYDYFWRRSVTCGVAAELLTAALQEKNDDIFVTALLHDIGVLTMYLSKGDEYAELLKQKGTSKASLTSLEEKRYGFDHQQLGATLVESWGLPVQIYEPMRYHHNSAKAKAEFKRTTEILWLADLLSAIYSESNSAEKVRLLQDEMEEHFNLPAEQVRELIDEVATKSIEILDMFELDAGDMKPYSQMLQEANDELGRLNLSYEQLVMELKEAKEKAELLANELSEANSRLKELVNRDGLTGLYNHRFFQETLSKEIARAIRYKSNLSLVLLDIDFFKKVNDNYGHPAGDLVLKNIASAVATAVRPSDVVARYGGEEFAVILPETNMAGMKVFSERIRRCAEGVVTLVEGQQIQVTISIGGTTFTHEHPEISKERLIDTADRGLYLSKKNGRNQVTILDALESSG